MPKNIHFRKDNQTFGRPINILTFFTNRITFNKIIFKGNFFCLVFRAAPVAYRGSQARGPITATAVSLCHSYSNRGSKPCL